ncbi:hypothetical protein BDW72DRAFT_107792 [Aspergillus terricola var. indicus]
MIRKAPKGSFGFDFVSPELQIACFFLEHVSFPVLWWPSAFNGRFVCVLCFGCFGCACCTFLTI